MRLNLITLNSFQNSQSISALYFSLKAIDDSLYFNFYCAPDRFKTFEKCLQPLMSRILLFDFLNHFTEINIYLASFSKQTKNSNS